MENTKSKKGVFKMVVLLIVVGFLVYGYFWFKSTQKNNEKAKASIQDAENYSVLINSIAQEKTRCQDFISGDSGDFKELDYCRGFIDWANKN